MFGDKKKMVATKSGIKLKSRSKRESFLPSDKAWLDTNPTIELDRYIDEGVQGAVYGIKGRPGMVVKVPKPYTYSDRTPSERGRYIQQEENEFNEEWQAYESLSLEDEPLIIPTKSVKITDSKTKGSFPGLVRPKIKVIGFGSNEYIPTDAEIEQLRQKVIALSARGITLVDGLQVGIDRAGRVQLYDLGFIQDRTPRKAAQKNQVMWEKFLQRFGKKTNKYGMINPSGRGSAKYLS